ncbi:hypothetical protein ACFV84_02255 [Kitasatospora sp. NPDC059811]|uniref:hypothetical protein n=1 Tax=Streptomycetaceae TaxID=2062 RepID=UPI0007AF32F0|nr:hypothetical protein [Streptomyces sp. MJM8645]
MAAPTHLLGPLPAAPHHRRTRRTGPGRPQRLIAAAVLGLTLPLAAASAAAAVGPASSSPPPFTAEPAVVGGPEPEAVPAVGPPQHPRPGRGDARVYRRWAVWAPEHADTAPDRAPGQAPGQAPAQVPEQNPDQVPDRSTGQVGAGDQPEADQGAPDTADAAAPNAAAASDAAAATAQAIAAAVPAVLPARWRDASTVQFPLGAGLGLIGCGLGLIGLRLRRG